MYDKIEDNVGGKQTGGTNTTLQVFQGKIKTLEVDDAGRETKVEVTVGTFKDTFNGNQVTLLNAGTVMTVEAKATKIDVRFKNGDEYTDNIGAQLMRMAVNMPAKEQLPDDIMRVFGTAKARKVGETWNGDKELLVSWINRNRTDKLPADAVAGSAKLVGLVKEGGVSYVDLEVTITQTFKNFTETVFNKKPANLKVNGEIKIVYTYRFPADFSSGPVKSSWKNNTNQRHEGTLEGQNAVMLTEIRDSWTEVSKYAGGKVPDKKDDKDPRPINPPDKEDPKASKDGLAVKFWLPKKVGDMRDITFTNNMFDKFNDTIAGKATNSSSTTLQVFKGTIKTVAVDNNGRETQAEVTVDTATDTYQGNQVTLLNPGTVLIAEAKPGVIELRFKNGGGVYNDNIGAAFLRKAINMPLPNSLADDVVRIFATNEPKKVGDTWTGNKDVLVAIVNNNRTDKLPAQAVSGKAKVLGLVKEAGVSYVDLEVTITTTFKDFKETVFNKKPANFNVNGDITTVFTYRFPADFSSGPVKSGWKNSVNQRHDGTLEGQNALMLTEIRDSWSETAKYYSSSGKN
jgi:putative sterol carrier protein